MYEQAVKTLLEASPDFTDIITGGIYIRSALSASQISPKRTPDAYEGGLILKPTLLLKSRDAQQILSAHRDDEKFAAFREILELWFYVDPYSPATSIEAAADVAFEVLHETRIPGGYKSVWIGSIHNIDAPELNNAKAIRSDYSIVGRRTT